MHGVAPLADVDHVPLVKRLWQTIWAATGQSPIKCLYNVVDLFLFRFLSDLRTLPDDLSFRVVQEQSRSDPDAALDCYVRRTRPCIRRMFPAGADGTTIASDTVFADAESRPNLTQSVLFRRCLGHIQRHADACGGQVGADQWLQSNLHDLFVNREVEATGQYFTPRKVVQSMVRMAGLDRDDFDFDGKRICDPFCGVGGFLVGVLSMNARMRAAFASSGGSEHPPFVLEGYDRGCERDDERTIVLAKANMLLHLSDELRRRPQSMAGIARVLNGAFTLIRDNLGTFGRIIEDEDGRFDVILSNPPYVTSGTSIVKEQLARRPHIAGRYPISGLGLESLAMEWIVRSLKLGGRAYVVIPDGLLARANGDRLRRHILRHCHLDALVSLPAGTFVANGKRTYIIVLTKKRDADVIQHRPVFTYLVQDIGECLSSVRRESIEEDDLPEMERLFREFDAGGQDGLTGASPRCRLQPFDRFREGRHWVVDRWWTRTERAALSAGNADAAQPALIARMDRLRSNVEAYGRLAHRDAVPLGPCAEVVLGDKRLFKTFIGKRALRGEVSKHGAVPIYSANVFKPLGFASRSRLPHFDAPTVLWGIDGDFQCRLVPAGQPFETTDHCGALRVLDARIVADYVCMALHRSGLEAGYDRSFRASLTNVRRIKIAVPVRSDGSFDVERQRALCAGFADLQEMARDIEGGGREMNALIKRFLAEPRPLD